VMAPQPERPRLLVATTNKGKLREIRGILSSMGVALVGLSETRLDQSFEESGGSFAENAAAKAMHFHSLSDLPTIADDSGLVVDALDGRPGILSSRYLGAGAPYSEKMAQILRELRGKAGSEREANFTCALSLAIGGRLASSIIKKVYGSIAAEPRGDGGFGYDPIFYSPQLGQTFGQAGQRDKDRMSHRGQALRALRALLETHEGLRREIGLAG